MNDDRLLKLLTDEIAGKTGFGEPGDWANHHFQALSESIKKSTGQHVSESTLKRLFGRKKTSGEVYQPHVYTRDILAVYAGYPSWNEYRKKMAETSSEYDVQKTGKSLKLWAAGAGAFLVVILILFLIRENRNPLRSFYCENPSGTIPFTSVFHYELRNSRDTVYIDFGNGEVFYLAPERNMITNFFKAADYPEVRVFTKKKILAKTKVHVKSGFWQGGVSPNDTTTAFIAFDRQDMILKPGRLYTMPEDLLSLGFNHAEGYYTEYRYFDEFNVMVDSIDLSIIARNRPEEGGRRCYDIEVILRGEHHDFAVRLMEPGCYRYARFRAGEKSYFGRFNDLSSLGQNVNDWSSISLKSEKGIASVYFNEKHLVQEEYSEEMGRLKGIVVRFFGCGSIDAVKLASGSSLIMDEDFGGLVPE